jgi:UDPglucose--hexose-1-phosphate uridylyltransferase
MTASERRQNLLTGEWTLVSPERMARPWRGAAGKSVSAPVPHHDPACHLCPRVTRMSGAVNPDYRDIFVFDNDFPALSSGTPVPLAADPLLVREPEAGVCRVVCYSPDHAARMGTMSEANVRTLIDAWTGQFAELDTRGDIGAVTIFENHGELAGASNPHPHGQIWATHSVPNELAKEEERQRTWLAGRGTALLAEVLAHELRLGTRIVMANDGFVALVPFWATWPFETLVLPRRQVAALTDMSTRERDDLAALLARLTRTYDRVFDAPFPYSMGVHQRPCGVEPAPHFTLHLHFFPPLLRSATIRKFMVGFELLAMPQRDLTPEAAAERLRALSSG